MPLLPLFRRPDGELVAGESPVRRMIPYLMRGRNESAVLHESTVDLTRTRAWLKAYNRCHRQPITLFHLFLWALGTGFFARRGVNRFVSGGRIYQRKGVQLSFAAKKKFREDSPLVTVKMPFADPEEKLPEVARRALDLIGEGRDDARPRTVDKEVALATRLPGPLVRLVLAVLRWLDRWNLLPGSMIENDPMYCTCFIANLGSIGIDRTFHHLYEYGTASLFLAIGVPRKTLVVGPTGQPEVRDAVDCRWTFDERINDGFYCAASLRHITRRIEDPERHLGPPEAGADR